MMDTRQGRSVFLSAVTAAFTCALVLASSASFAQDAQTPEAAQPQQTGNDRVLEFPGKWVKRCNDSAEGKFCEISFGSIVDVGERQVWLSRVGIFESGDQRDLFMFTPLGSALRRGVLYRVDESAPQQAAYSVCIQLQGCQAITQIDTAAVDALKAGSQFQVQFTVANRPPMVGVVTLAGFTAAYDGEPEITVGGADAGAQAPSDEPPAANGAGEAVDPAGGKGDAPQ